jgi:hypothetical protein
MHVDVTIGVPHPETVDIAVVAAQLPYGTVTVTAILGGLEIPGTDGVDAILIANAAIVVSLDDDAAPARRAGGAGTPDADVGQGAQR